MNISIFGLGYVGCISLGCLAKNGHRVIGVDVNPYKVSLVKAGRPTVIEKDIDRIIEQAHEAGLIDATTQAREAVSATEAALICVGTPNDDETGQLNLEYVEKVAQEIGEALTGKKDFFTVLIRSTVPPGTNERCVRVIEAASGKKHCEDFAVVSNPEFLREGSAVHDYEHPPYTVIGSDCPRGLEVARRIYEKIEAPFEEMEIRSAELLKYVNNSFHALKITFANEVGNIAHKLGIDSHRLMEVFVKDTKLNVSAAYLKPGFAFGGSCLPKDLRALNAFAHDFYLKTPVLQAIDESNKEQIHKTIRLIESKNKKSIGFVGISFKAGTDDMRFSPALEVVEYFIGKGYKVRIFDSNVHLSKLTGTNKQYIESKLPHISEILVDNLPDMLEEIEVLCISIKENGIEQLEIKDSIEVIDLVRVKELEDHPRYKGIAW